jgi:hypothetical protein
MSDSKETSHYAQCQTCVSFDIAEAKACHFSAISTEYCSKKLLQTARATQNTRSD